MITLVGVGHVFKLDDELREDILRSRPAVVAVELDRNNLARVLARKLGHELREVREKGKSAPSDPGSPKTDSSPQSEDQVPGAVTPDPEGAAAPGLDFTLDLGEGPLLRYQDVPGAESPFWTSQHPGNLEAAGTSEVLRSLRFNFLTRTTPTGNFRFEILDPGNSEVKNFYLRRGDVERLTSPSSKKGTPLKYRLIAWLQEWLSEANQVEPGDEMLAGVEAALLLGCHLSIIDTDSPERLMQAHNQMGFVESMKLNLNLVYAIIKMRFLQGRKKASAQVKEELFRFEEGGEDYMEEFSRKFPVFNREILEARNHYMAENICGLAQSFGDIFVLVGEAHLEGIHKILLESLPGDAIRIKHLFEFEEFRKLQSQAGG